MFGLRSNAARAKVVSQVHLAGSFSKGSNLGSPTDASILQHFNLSAKVSLAPNPVHVLWYPPR